MRFHPPLLHPRAIGAATLLIVLAVFVRPAAADFFQFGTTITLGGVTPLPNSITGNGTDLVTLTTAGNTPIVFSGLSTSPPENLVATNGGTDIVFALIDTQVVNATPLQNLSIPFTLDVTITDYPTDIVGVPDGVGVFQITGVISGEIGAGRRVTLNNISLNPVAPILIGGKPYALTLNTIVPPGPFFPGAIGAHVEIVPEPGSIILFGLGLIGLVTPVLRRRLAAARAARI